MSSKLIKKNLWKILIALAVVPVMVSLIHNQRTDITEMAASNFGRQLSSRMSKLDAYMRQMMDSDHSSWTDLAGLPDDMAIYRYGNDSLKSWSNQFTLDNDDISRKMHIARFSYMGSNSVSPLADATEEPKFMELGPNWYIVKGIGDEHGCKIIGGIEVKNSMDGRTMNGVSSKLRLSDRFSIHPITYTGGAPVRVDGIPLMKIIQENAKVSPHLPHPIALWAALALLLASILSYLYNHRSLKGMLRSVIALSLVLALFLYIGKVSLSSSRIFSPMLYSGGRVFYSLASALIWNLWIVLTVTALYLVRIPFARVLRRGRQKWRMSLYSSLILLLVIAISVYTHLTLRSIIMNSSISLELNRVGDLSPYSLLIYLSYLSLLMAVVLLCQMLRPVIHSMTGRKCDLFSTRSRVVISLLGAAYLLSWVSMLSFDKETKRVELWANRLAKERNLEFEVRLRRVETAISADPIITSLIPWDKDLNVTMRRVKESYLNVFSQDYDINLLMFNDSKSSPEILSYFRNRIAGGVKIDNNSVFIYSRSATGRAMYTGLFTYYTKTTGVTNMIACIDSKTEKEGTGYSALMGNGTAVIPQRYSYAKYISGNLTSYGGDYSYPTVFPEKMSRMVEESGSGHIISDKYRHFLTPISDEEAIIISRKKDGLVQYAVSGFLIAIVAYFGLTLPKLKRRRKSAFETNYYKSRINTILFLSLLSTLVAMASVSVVFVYNRNEANVKNLMIGKISTIQSLVEARCRDYQAYDDFYSQEFSGALESIGGYTKSDISLYSTDGKVFLSTSPDVFEKAIMGSRLNHDAFRSIMYNNKRYYIHREKFSGISYYSMYAPLINGNGRKIAVICAPYTDAGIEFKHEAAFHALFIVTLFFLLMFIARFLTIKMVDKMFRPLIEMGLKMNSARINGLEYIIYDRDDEISTLVHAYNLMVHDLSESTKQAAHLERDKAWSEMARQVAHEIKNPLTPIKLQIQRIIRLKQKKDPSWMDKFDTVVPIIMDSIDELTDTANEFSTFAKLYSEEPVLINLDELASRQVTLFDEKENISFSYYGLQNSMVMGPKPQITRVFVNLLTNAVQAIENQRKEILDSGGEVTQGRVLLSIRNSMRDGFYDIVVEDNGPGVKDENRGRLFTPNFTTKSSGTGLGLAICKNIIERCGGEIRYSRSFTLKGACFTFVLPKA